MKTSVIIPVKTFHKSKTRLHLSEEKTKELCKLLLEEVIKTISETKLIDKTIVVTDEDGVSDIIKKYDEDSSGGLDMEEFKRFLKEAAGGDPPTDNEVMWVAQTATPERLSQEELKNLQIKIEHLRSALLAWSDYKERQLEINGIFNKYDKDGDADLDKEELKDFVRDLLEQKDMRTVAENSKDKREAVSQNLQKLFALYL